MQLDIKTLSRYRLDRAKEDLEDVGFQFDLPLAAQGAARCGGQRVDPLPAGLQHLPEIGRAHV